MKKFVILAVVIILYHDFSNFTLQLYNKYK